MRNIIDLVAILKILILNIFKVGLFDLDKGNFTKNLNTNLNGGFNFITDKNFKPEKFEFFLQKINNKF